MRGVVRRVTQVSDRPVGLGVRTFPSLVSKSLGVSVNCLLFMLVPSSRSDRLVQYGRQSKGVREVTSYPG